MKKGFTLIELLVVVLIIGILASVAVPKYTAMIEKGKAAEAMQNLHAIVNSVKRYFTTYNSYPVEFKDLDISVAGSAVPSGSYAADSVKQNKNFVFYMRSLPTTPEIVFCRINATRSNINYMPHSTADYCLSYYLVPPPAAPAIKADTYSCAAIASSKLGQNVCKTLTGAKTKLVTSWGIDFYAFP